MIGDFNVIRLADAPSWRNPAPRSMRLEALS
jgi:hypothetical protein